VPKELLELREVSTVAQVLSSEVPFVARGKLEEGLTLATLNRIVAIDVSSSALPGGSN